MPQSSGQAQPARGPRRVRVARADALQGPGPHAVSADGLDLVLVRTGDAIRAFQGRCPHQGALLGEGELESGALVCRNHRWRFGLEDGCREGGCERLASYPVLERDGDVLVDLDATAARERPPAATTRSLRDLPGPSSLPLIGNLFQLDRARLHEVLEQWAIEYGPIYRYRFGVRPVVVVSDHRLSEQILRARPDAFRRMSTVEPVFSEMGVAGVFSAEGAAWRPQRRLAMEALSPRHLRGFYPVLRTVVSRLRARWQRASQSATPVDVADDLKRFTVDVTTLLAFGHDLNTLEQQGDQIIQRKLEQIFPAFNRRLFAVVPRWRLIRSAADRRLDRALADLRAWLQRLVDEARARMAADAGLAERPSNFLEAMLSARDDAGRPFSDDVIFGNLMTMLLAGEDTTAYTLAWAVHHLCDSPEAVAALRAELDATLGSADVPPDLETANRLSYAGAVTNEVMRLRPVAPLSYHDTNVDVVVGDLSLPAGTRLVVLTRPPAMDAASFKDPQAFRPSRWLAPVGAHETSAHMPFGSGPRLCPGRGLALLEMKVALATIYKSFDLTRAGASQVRERFAFTMFPVGLTVGIAPRRTGAAAGTSREA
jgi:cytochrome P450/nitrite reductase/ring-hydroxylating ferredoxin subunit